MKKLAVALAVPAAAAALLGGSAVNASDDTVKTKATIDVRSTDISSRRRHYRHYSYRHHLPYYHSTDYPSYGYAPSPYYGGGYSRVDSHVYSRVYGWPYYYGGGYDYGAPGTSFGGGGYRGR